VGSVIEKYGVEEASARALRHKYIEDKDYLSRILPEYSAENIDCIIVVHSPEGTRFFLENGEVHTEHDDHKYIELASEDFVASLNKAPKQDVIDFWLGLH
jgi:uroporphyrinogen-III synthase